MTTTTTIKKMVLTAELKKVLNDLFVTSDETEKNIGHYTYGTEEYGDIELWVSMHTIHVKQGNEYFDYNEVFTDENGNSVTWEYMRS
jgi:hypothetical protein